MQQLISVENLCKSYNDNIILNNISFEIKEREIFGIMGKSGSGKSTLLRCINGLISYDSGLIAINGINPQELSEKELNNFRTNIGMIFQSFSLVERLNVYENIALPLKILKKSKSSIKEKVTNIAKLVEIEDKLNTYPKYLSGGQKQRVAIARALVTEPQLILSDESTSALDPETTDSIIDLFKKLNSELGITFVIVTHEIDLIKKLSDRVLVLRSNGTYEVTEPQAMHIKQMLGNTTTNIQNNSNRFKINVLLDLQHTKYGINSLIDLDKSCEILSTNTTEFKNNSLTHFIVNCDSKKYIPIVNKLNSLSVDWGIDNE